MADAKRQQDRGAGLQAGCSGRLRGCRHPGAGQYEASGEAAGDCLAPQYPLVGDLTIPKGQCVKGWIYFDVPKRARLRQVNYANDAGDTHS